MTSAHATTPATRRGTSKYPPLVNASAAGPSRTGAARTRSIRRMKSATVLGREATNAKLFGHSPTKPAFAWREGRRAPAGGADHARPYPRRLDGAPERPSTARGAGRPGVRHRAVAAAREGVVGHEDRPACRPGRLPGRRRERVVLDRGPRARAGRAVRRLPVPDGAVLRARPLARAQRVADAAPLVRVDPRAGGLGGRPPDGRARGPAARGRPRGHGPARAPEPVRGRVQRPDDRSPCSATPRCRGCWSPCAAASAPTRGGGRRPSP